MPCFKSILLSTALLLSTIHATPTSLAPSLPAAAIVTATSTSLLTHVNTTISTTARPAATSIHCDITYCVNGTSFCHFWAGISSWHIGGPLPGEVRTTLGSCKLGKERRTAA
ncbi:hypothetical protein ACQKWADRAFT_277736 [Trichoderma austrokoningii]